MFNIRNIIIALVVGFFAVPLNAEFYPLENKPVLDKADIIDAQDEQKLNDMLFKFEKENGRQLAVITVPSLDGRDIDDFSVNYAQFLGLGSDKNDDGVMFIIAPNERSMRIEVGRGLEYTLTDVESGRIISNIKPYFKAGEYSKGIVVGTELIIPNITADAVEKSAAAAAVAKQRADKFWGYVMNFFGWIIGIGITLASIWWVSMIPARRREKQKDAFTTLKDMVSKRNYPLSPAAITDDMKKTCGPEYDEGILRRLYIGTRDASLRTILPMSEEEQLLAISSHEVGVVLGMVQNPSASVIEKAIKYDPEKVVKSFPNLLNDGMINQLINDNPTIISLLENPTTKMRMKAAKLGVLVENATDEEIGFAIKSNPSLFSTYRTRLNTNQTNTALADLPENIQWIPNPTEEQQMLAVRNNLKAVQYIKKPSPAVQQLVVSQNRQLARSINNPSDFVKKIKAELVAEDIVAERKMKAIRKKKEAEQKEQEARRKIQEEQEQEQREERRRRERSYSNYSSSSSSSSSSWGGSSSSSSSSFGGGGGDFGGGGSSGDW